MFSDLATRRLAGLFPSVGPWTAAALWHGVAELPAPSVPLEAELATIVSQRLSGLLLRYLTVHGVRVQPALLTTLRRYTSAWLVSSDAVVRSAAEVVADLAGAGIACVVSKGPGIAATFANSDERPFADVDLVVHPEHFASAAEFLIDAGWREDLKSAPPRHYFIERCREGINLKRGAGESVDVHHRVPPWLWSRGVDIDALLRRSESVHRAGVTLPCLSTEDNLLVAALHVVSDRNHAGQSLMVWRDIRQLAGAADPNRVEELAAAAHLTGWLRAVLAALPRAASCDRLLDHLAAGNDVASPTRLAVLLSPRAERSGLFATQFLRLPLGNAIAFAAGMFVPSHEFLRAKFEGHRHPYLAWWRLQRRGLPADADPAKRASDGLARMT